MNQISPQSVGVSMRSCRHSRKITRTRLSRMADVPYSSLSRAEHGECFMSLPALCACAHALSISLDEYTGFNINQKGGTAPCSIAAK